MYLKALEIQGFKSFPEKTRLTFEKEITGIVGPNGSGKSNISDALLWVMGEQRSRALRGGKMEDVIFGGTEKRSPLGFAQVSLVLDNSKGLLDIEEPEVTITRRYYRNGESEYYLNRETCRLKDVITLLMDTGLGRDGYSVIGQGRISEIVSAKSVDRREIFEEAAGIAKFRLRKEEAERKLRHTEDNLTRINDKIEELQLQVEPLREQAETAKKFLLLRDEQRGLEISVWMQMLDALSAQAQQVNADYEKAQEGLDAAQRELSEHYADSDKFKEKMQECDRTADQLRERLHSHEAAANECENSVGILQANLLHNNENISRIRAEISEQSGRAHDLREQISGHKARLLEIEETCAKVQLDIKDIIKASEASADGADEMQRGLAALVSGENAKGELLAQTKMRISMLEDKGQTLAERRAGIDSDMSEGEAKYKEMSEKLRIAKGEQAEAKTRLEEIQNVISGHRMLMSGREGKVRELSEKLTALTVENQGVKNRIRMLSDMEKEFEGLGKAVKEVMREVSRGTLRGVHGPVASLVKAQDKYAIAIETALGGAMQNIVVDRQDDGKTAIEMLKRTGGGRATFLPISTVKPYSMRHDLNAEDGFLGIAAELVSFDKRFNNIFASLLGRTVVVETLGDAVRISKKFKNELRIVSLDGQLINAGGSMTGGSSAKNVGILSRSNELKSLQEKDEKLTEALAKCKSDHESAERELQRAKYELEVATGELTEATKTLHDAESSVSQLKLMQSAVDEALEGFDAEKTGLSSKISENDKEMALSREDAARLEVELLQLKSEIEKESEGQKNFAAEREALSARLSALRAELASLETEREVEGRATQSLERLLEAHEGDESQRRQNIAELEKKSLDIESDIMSTKERAEAIKEKIAETNREIQKANELRLELEGRRTAADKMAQLKNADLLEKQQILARYEQKKLSSEMEEKQILDKLWDNYELSRSAASALRQELESTSAATKRISELRRDIARLGSVNIGAIEEYDRVSERYNFLKDQRDDISGAKADLEKIICDITGEMQAIFVREFTAINAEFKNVFADLFGGGKASLELEDDENVLECGIDIKVQPPGKAVTTISLLSGGEKSFVAIALYFAIMKVRPTPFCIMDEIEAALDEANVVRYAQYMRSLTKSTQFIVITHRRGTMEEADILYGVTMQEKGVTTVISVDLDQAERTLK